MYIIVKLYIMLGYFCYLAIHCCFLNWFQMYYRFLLLIIYCYIIIIVHALKCYRHRCFCIYFYNLLLYDSSVLYVIQFIVRLLYCNFTILIR